MGAYQSTYPKDRRQSALRVLETIKPRIAGKNRSQIDLLNYLYGYINYASSSAKYSVSFSLLERKLKKYLSSAVKDCIAGGRSALFLAQFDDDQRQLALQLSYANVCIQDLELFEQILTAVRRREVLPFGEFIVERPNGQIGRVQSMHLQMKNELEQAVLSGPAGGYASARSSKYIPWWETKGENEIEEENAGIVEENLRRPARHSVNRTVSSICSAPDNLRIQPDSTTKPLFHSATVKETRSTPRPSKFSSSTESTASKLRSPPNAGPNPRIQSLTSTVLSSRDWLENTTTTLRPRPVNKNLSAVAAYDKEHFNPRDSWTSSIHSDESCYSETTNNALNIDNRLASLDTSLPSPTSPVSPTTTSSIPTHGESSRSSSLGSDTTAVSSAPSLDCDTGSKVTSQTNSPDTITPPTEEQIAPKQSDVVIGEAENRDRKRYSEGFSALYKVRQNLDKPMDGVRISLNREDLAEVRIEDSGSYVKVDAWVPLGNVYNHLDFKTVRQISAAK